MKKFLSFLLILLVVSCCGCSKSPQKLTVSVYGGETEINHYEEIEKGFLSALEANGLRDYQLVDSSELTTELLENREGITIIERCIGMAINAETGDGVILNSPSNRGWYIACPTDGCYTLYKVGDYQMRDGTVFCPIWFITLTTITSTILWNDMISFLIEDWRSAVCMSSVMSMDTSRFFSMASFSFLPIPCRKHIAN